MNPLDQIDDPYRFQHIVAEYFRYAKQLKQFNFHDVTVRDNGVGADGGCDIFVEFSFSDEIDLNNNRWVVEFKSQKKAVHDKDININSIDGIIKSNNAHGYLLVCKFDATSKLKNIFETMSKNGNFKYTVWNGSQLWGKFVESKRLIKAFFPDHYNKYFIQNSSEKKFNKLVSQFTKKLKD